MSYYLDDEDRADIEINKQEVIILNELSQNEDILEFIKDNYKILSDFEERKMTYVVKAEKLGESIVVKMRQNIQLQLVDVAIFNEVINESFVGLLGTNTLNSKNFAKVLAGNPSGLCSEKFYDPKGYKIKYLGSERRLIQAGKINCAYAVYEYIPGISLQDFIPRQGTVPNLKKIYWELFSALYEANKKIDFTHYDLHPYNVIVKDNLTPVIIDYGSSHIKYEGKDYGREFARAKIINKSRWYHDVVKILWHNINLTDKPIMLERFTNVVKYIEAYKNSSDEYFERLFDKVREYLIGPDSGYEHLDSVTVILDKESISLRGITFPKQGFDFGPIARKLLAFFGLNDITLKEFNKAKDNFFHPSDDIIARNPSFEDFMTYVEPILT